MRILLLMIVSAVSLAGCSTDKYPVTGEECEAGDPVQEMDAADCIIPGATSGGFF